MNEHLAHIKLNRNGNWEKHMLEDHLGGVAELAGTFSSAFNNSDWGYTAAMLHDLGKLSKKFQHDIRFETGFDTDSNPSSGKKNHSTHGAYWAFRHWGSVGKILSYIIAGHHAGLPDWYDEVGVGGGLAYRLSQQEVEALPSVVPDLINQYTKDLKPPTSLPCSRQIGEEHIHLWIRMLFSCLVDADFLDTERFMDTHSFRLRSDYEQLAELKTLFDNYMDGLLSTAADTKVNRVRRSVLESCRSAGESPSGFFTLTVPTGGGKTLSSMAFALEHALTHGKKRIIMVIPYTSIIEQTASVYKDIFGQTNVIEHHSNLDPDNESKQSQLASENWDAPIIVTTNVQFFESLHAARSSACRKIHNIVNSVVIFDEAQMLPTDFLKPILNSLKGLVELFRVSTVFCTATQPALCGSIGTQEAEFSILQKDECNEIVPDNLEHFKQLRRVEVFDHGSYSDWYSLSEELIQYEQVLCIVNTRKDCKQLYEGMPDGTVHLSGSMCAEHRSEKIEMIRTLLQNGAPIRVISTQLVEAGVDIDFPVVYRAEAGMDSIAQAAGRCNREGKLLNNSIPVSGKVVVFDPPNKTPPGELRKTKQAGREILSLYPQECRELHPEVFERYYKLHYSNLNSFDKQNIMSSLTDEANPDLNIQFRTAAKNFKLIDDKFQKNILVWHKSKHTDSLDLIEQLERYGPNRTILRKLQRFFVSVPNRVFDEVKINLKEVHGIWCQDADTLYDEDLGFVGFDNVAPVSY